jgi:hypothetical protein
VFQAYGSYWPEGYIAHLAWASAWMCKYSSSFCPTAVEWFNTALNTNNLRYGLGYDWDSTFPGVAALMVSMQQPSVAAAAKSYLEGYILPKWEVRQAVSVHRQAGRQLHARSSIQPTSWPEAHA